MAEEEKKEKKKPSTPRKRTPKKNMSLLPDEGQLIQYSLFAVWKFEFYSFSKQKIVY